MGNNKIMILIFQIIVIGHVVARPRHFPPIGTARALTHATNEPSICMRIEHFHPRHINFTKAIQADSSWIRKMREWRTSLGASIGGHALLDARRISATQIQSLNLHNPFGYLCVCVRVNGRRACCTRTKTLEHVITRRHELRRKSFVWNRSTILLVSNWSNDNFDTIFDPCSTRTHTRKPIGISEMAHDCRFSISIISSDSSSFSIRLSILVGSSVKRSPTRRSMFVGGRAILPDYYSGSQLLWDATQLAIVDVVCFVWNFISLKFSKARRAPAKIQFSWMEHCSSLMQKKISRCLAAYCLHNC